MDQISGPGVMMLVTAADQGEVWISVDGILRIYECADGSSELVQADGGALHVIAPTFAEWFREEWWWRAVEGGEAGAITDEQGEAWLRERLRHLLHADGRAGRIAAAAVYERDCDGLQFGAGYSWRITGDEAWRDEG